MCSFGQVLNLGKCKAGSLNDFIGIRSGMAMEHVAENHLSIMELIREVMEMV